MKLIKIIFNRTIIIILSLALQLALFFSFTLKFNKFSLAVQIVGTFLGFLVFLHMVNKKESPEFKLPWLFLLVVLPYFGTLIYIMFANPRLSKKQTAITKKTYEDLRVIINSADNRNDVKDFLDDKIGIENYLRKTAGSFGHVDSTAEYFKSGEDFFSDLLIELNNAKQFIFMEYFIISHGKMWNSILEILKDKVSSGVEVRIIYDDLGSLGKVSAGYYKTLNAMNIKCVKANPFRPILSGIYNNRDHRKITIIDGKVGYTGGINIGDEYINHTSKFGYWKDNAIKIKGNAVLNLTCMFLSFYHGITKTQAEYEKYLPINNSALSSCGYIHPFGDGPKPFYSEQIGENNFINLINQAKNYIYITTPYLIIDHNLTTAIKNAAYRGVDVKIILPHVPDKKIIFNVTRSHYDYLLKCGVKIYEFTPGFVHAKTMLIDDELAFIGTINFDYRSLVHHFECGVVLYKCNCIKDVKEDLQSTLKKCQMITADNFHMNGFTRLINSILAIFFPLL